jgi:hypothetical protein
MSSYLDALLSGASAATKLATSTSGVVVDVGNAPPPLANQVLTATSSTTATWQNAPATGDLETNVPGAPVDIGGAAPPVPGQVLTAVDAEHAIWRVPGLHYDPSIKFWTSSVGSATITSGTWGFVLQPPAATDPVVVYIVSSLEAPPVDARFALYVGRDVTVPVTINVLGASQIQGLDGVLGTSAALLPGADYEWVFYHEDGAALWGLVSDTAGVGKRLITNAGLVELGGSAPPSPGDVLTAIDAGNAEWLPPGGGGGGLVLGSGSSPDFGEWVNASTGVESMLPDPDEADRRVAIYVSRGTTGASVTCAGASLMIDRNTVNDAPLRPGAWYEWVSRDFGEDIRWVPVGGSGTSARPPLEYPIQPYGALEPNQWVLSSDVGGAVNMPQSPKHGDSFAVYVDGEGCGMIPATGHSVESPDGTETVLSPDNLSVPGASYYEWIWIAGDLTWRTRQNVLVLRPDAVASAIRDDDSTSVFDVGDKKIASVLEPIDPNDAATKAYVDAKAGVLPTVPASDISTSIAPLHWWRADNTVQTGGLVDTIVDNGTSPINFTQTGAARCPVATDGLSHDYLAFDGAADYYLAGVASNWAFMSDGTTNTLALIFAQPTIAGADQTLIATAGFDPSKIGFELIWSVVSSTQQGPSYAVSRASSPNYVLFVEDRSLYQPIQVFILRNVGAGLELRNLGGCTSGANTVQVRRNGVMRTTSYRNASFGFNSAAPSHTLSLGARNTGAQTQFSSARIYDVVLDNKVWSDDQCLVFERYARGKGVVL